MKRRAFLGLAAGAAVGVVAGAACGRSSPSHVLMTSSSLTPADLREAVQTLRVGHFRGSEVWVPAFDGVQHEMIEEMARQAAATVDRLILEAG